MANGILDGADCGIILIYLCRDRPHGIRQVGPHIADRHGLVSLQQHVISDRYDLGAVFDAEASVVDGHGIAEPELLQRSDVLVFLCLPQGHEGYLDSCRDAGFRICPDIALGAGAELFLGGPLQKIGAHVHRNDHAVYIVITVLRVDDLLRQRDQRFLFLIIESYPEGHDSGPDVAGVRGLLDIRQVFAVADHDSCVDSSAGMELHRKAVPFKLAGAVHIQDGPGHTAEKRPDGGRLRDSERSSQVLVRPYGKGTVALGIVDQALQGCCAVICRERHRHHLGKLVGDVPCIDRHDPVHRTGDLINPERLDVLGVVMPCADDALLHDVGVVKACDRIFQLQLILAVPFLHHLAADCVRKSAQPIGDKLCFSGRVKNRLHRHHHLGIISIFSMPVISAI